MEHLYGIIWLGILSVLVVVFSWIAIAPTLSSRQKAAVLERRTRAHFRYNVSNIPVLVNGYRGVITNLSLEGAAVVLDEPISPQHQGPYVMVKMKADDQTTIISLKGHLVRTQTYSLRVIHVEFDVHDAMYYRGEITSLIIGHCR